jgi:hypothetical protein
VATVVAAVIAASGAASAAPNTDPDLEPGFPVQTYETAGTYHGGPAVLSLVGNIDSDPTLEILATALAGGPLYAWNSDGSPQPGWPVSTAGQSMPALGQLSTANPGLEVFSASFGGLLLRTTARGKCFQAGRARRRTTSRPPPSLGDVDGDGLDEIFTEEEDWALHALPRANGTVLQGWPVSGDGGQERHTAAIGDLDGDGVPEIVTVSGWTSPGIYVHAYHRGRQRGRRVPGADGRRRRHIPGDRGRGRLWGSGDRPRGGGIHVERDGPGGERDRRADDDPRRLDRVRDGSGARRPRWRRRARDRRADR